MDQENFEDIQDFDLDSILNEFGSGSQPAGEDQPRPEENAALSDDAFPTLDFSLDEIPEEPEAPAEMPELNLDGLLDSEETTSETDRSTQIFAPVADALEPKDTPEGDTIRFDSPEAESALEGDTIRLDSPETESAPAGDTLDAPEAVEEKTGGKEPIPFRSNLKELKRKIVAGPERRYYDLSDEGVLKLQIAIVLNLVIVGLCVATTTMWSKGLIPENRLRLVVFSQVLAMLTSALLGCYQIMDGVADVFKGRFNINTMLFFTLLACLGDAWFCLQELRVPCCSCFALEMTFALFGRYHRRSTEIAQMDTLRKAIHLHSVVKEKDYLNGKVFLRGDGDVDDFLDTYDKPSGPQRLQSVYCFFALLGCASIAVLAGLRYGPSLALQVLSTSLLAAVPVSFFVALTRPAAILQNRLHMVGSVICGWQGVKGLLGKAYFPMKDSDLFPQGSTKLNGVKFYGSLEPEQILAYTTSLIAAAGGGLLPLFRNMLKNRGGSEYPVTQFRDYGLGGIGGEISGDTVLMGDLHFLNSMDVDIPQGTTVSQAVYVAINGQLSAVIAISYAKMRSASAGLVSLNGCRRVKPVLLCDDFLITSEFIHSKFGVNTRRMLFPDRQTREELAARQVDPESPVLALTIRDELVSSIYTVTGASALYASSTLGLLIHLLGGIVGMLIMFVLAFQGSMEILTPTNVLLYQLVWMVPGLLVTEWARTV